jgi:uncharacterized protein YndB with AHSA1/START domain
MKEIQNDRELIFNRLLDAPRELVFKVWTDPEHVVKWWGPTGFTNTNHGMDVSKNGVWRFTMHGPDGVDYKNKIVFLEVKEPELLVYKHSDDEDTEPIHFHVTITFEAQGNKTNLTMHMVFDTKEELEKVARDFGAIEGAHQHIARLEDYISSPSAHDTSYLPFEITKEFNASPDLVFDMFSRAEHLAHWWGPKGMDTSVEKLDFRPGGNFHYKIKGENGMLMHGKFTYRDIVPLKKIVYVDSFADENWNIIAPPFHDPWPREIYHIVTITGDQHRTKLTMSSIPIHAAAQEQQTFNKGFAAMQEGYGGTLEQLTDYLKEITMPTF